MKLIFDPKTESRCGIYVIENTRQKLCMSQECYTESYYKTRNYHDYLTRKFDALALDVVREAGISVSDRIIDFGCGYGGLMNALTAAGFPNVRGTDISMWAVDAGKDRFPALASRIEFYNRNLLTTPYALLLLLDVLEHMPDYEIEIVLKLAALGCHGCIVARIPVCAEEGEPFVLPVSNNDPTHICCHAKPWWFERFAKANFLMEKACAGQAIYDSPGVLACVFRLKD